mgnify:CR=1 FL=1
MLFAEPTEHSAGVFLWGDWWDLNSLHSSIHGLVANSPYDETINNTLLGLAYDVRKAYEKQREEKQFGHDLYDCVTYRGERILWPIILFQVNSLRHLAAYQPTSRECQANLYRVEHCLEESLLQTDSAVGKECIEWLFGPCPLTTRYYTLFLGEAARRYVSEHTGKARFESLPNILRTLHPMSAEYLGFAADLERQAREASCDSRDLDDFSEGGEILW